MKTITINEIPLNKTLPNTNFIIDYFQHIVEEATYTFLTHFHADHYRGLTKKFTKKIICSETTGNLLKTIIGIKDELIIPLKMYTSYFIDGVEIICIEANHCPGAVCFIFHIKNLKIFHTGDFRFSKTYHNGHYCPIKKMYENTDTSSIIQFDKIYLDNTFEGEPNFNNQEEVIINIVGEIRSLLMKRLLVPLKYKFIFGSYLIGKEKLYLAVAHYFNWEIQIDAKKYKILNCYSTYTVNKLNEYSERIKELCIEKYGFFKDRSIFKCRNKQETPNHKLAFDRFQLNKTSPLQVISVLNINETKINEMLKGEFYNKIFIFIGTGWKRKIKYFNFKYKTGIIRKGIECKYISYSEHTSPKELEEFKDYFKGVQIINTVEKKNLA